MEIGNKIFKLRKKNNLSQEELAEKVGVARQTISKWELGETNPDLKQAKELSRIFNVSLDELACDKNKEESSVAEQFNKSEKIEKYKGKKIITVIGLGIADLFTIIFFIVLVALNITMAGISLTFATIGICLIGRLNIYSLIPTMPYLCGLIIGFAFISLAILVICGLIYFIKLTYQLFNSYKRFHYNTMAIQNGKTILPSFSCRPEFSKKAKCRISLIVMFSASAFIACFVVGMILCMLLAGEVEFWHTWGWF